MRTIWSAVVILPSITRRLSFAWALCKLTYSRHLHGCDILLSCLKVLTAPPIVKVVWKKAKRKELDYSALSRLRLKHLGCHPFGEMSKFVEIEINHLNSFVIGSRYFDDTWKSLDLYLRILSSQIDVSTGHEYALPPAARINPKTYVTKCGIETKLYRFSWLGDGFRRSWRLDQNNAIIIRSTKSL